jgi:hypothetical protein
MSKSIQVAAMAVALALVPPDLALARQSGSLPLSEIITMSKPYPNLLLQIRLELVRANTTRDKITCKSDQLEGAWKKLSASRVGPYQCLIGKRLLTVTTTPTYFDERGYKISQRAPDLAMKAVRVEEAKLKWTWK